MSTNKLPPTALAIDGADNAAETQILTSVSSATTPTTNNEEDSEDIKLCTQPPHSPKDTDRLHLVQESGEPKDGAPNDSSTVPAGMPIPPTRQYALEVLGEETLQDIEGSTKFSKSNNGKLVLSTDTHVSVSKPGAIVEDKNKTGTDSSEKEEAKPDSLHGEWKDVNVNDSKPEAIVEDINPTGTETSEKEETKTNSLHGEWKDVNVNDSKPEAIVEDKNQTGTEASEKEETKTNSLHGEWKDVNVNDFTTEAIVEDRRQTGTKTSEKEGAKADSLHGEEKSVDVSTEGEIQPGTEASKNNNKEENAVTSPKKLNSGPKSNTVANVKKGDDQEQTEGMCSLKEKNPNAAESNPPSEAKQSEPEATIESMDIAKVPEVALSAEQKEKLRAPRIAMLKNRATYWKEDQLDDDRLKEGWSLHWCRRGDIGSKKGDKYWVTPTGLLLRSKPEIDRFLQGLITCNGDEDRARKLAVGRKSPKKTRNVMPSNTMNAISAKTKKATPAKKRAPAEKKEKRSAKLETSAQKLKKSPAKRKAKGSKTSPVTPTKVPRTATTIGNHSMTNAVQRASLSKGRGQAAAKKKLTVTKKIKVTKHSLAAKIAHKAASQSANNSNHRGQRTSIKRTPKPLMAVASQGSTEQVTAEPKSNIVRRKVSSKKTAARQPAIQTENKLGVPAEAESK